MDELLPPSMLWAMHPVFLSALTRQRMIESLLPPSLGFMRAGQHCSMSAKPSDPTRQGSVIVLPVHGVLAPAGMIGGGTSYEQIANRVRDAAADSRIATIVLDVRSQGGTVWGCMEAADAIYQARAIKPVIAVASPYCFSAAYWLAMQASRVYATQSGDVGSVGVRSGHTDMSGFESKIGIKTTLIASSVEKIAAHPHAPLSDQDRADIQADVDASYRTFAHAIARGRGMKVGDVAAVHGTGKTFSAKRAYARGAIDGVASLRDVVTRYSSSGGRDALKSRLAAANALARLV